MSFRFRISKLSHQCVSTFDSKQSIPSCIGHWIRTLISHAQLGVFWSFGLERVEAFASLLNQYDESNVSHLKWWHLCEQYVLLSVLRSSFFAYHYSVAIVDRISSCSLWHLTTTECCMLSIVRFIAVAREEALRFHGADSCILPIIISQRDCPFGVAFANSNSWTSYS